MILSSVMVDRIFIVVSGVWGMGFFMRYYIEIGGG